MEAIAKNEQLTDHKIGKAGKNITGRTNAHYL